MINNRFILPLICFMFWFNLAFPAQHFPSITPYASGMLQVDDIHQIYWEESGNPHGIPVLFLHGGPGSATNEDQRRFFDPSAYRIILFDQRGCGKSLPNACLTNNTTWDLVEDIEKLRKMLKIDRALLFGGSWGTTLALAYAIKYPENVSGMILRGIFLCRQHELDWFYRDSVKYASPKAWEIFISRLSAEDLQDPVKAYQRLLYTGSSWDQACAAAAWVLWEFANMQSKSDARLTALLNFKPLFYLFAKLYEKQNKTMARIENHYFFNRGFFETDNWILENIDRIKDIPAILVHGEEDQICPLEGALDLQMAWGPASNLLVIPGAGHSAEEQEVLDALIYATDEFKIVR